MEELKKVLTAIEDGYGWRIETWPSDIGTNVYCIVVENPDYENPWDDPNLTYTIGE